MVSGGQRSAESARESTSGSDSGDSSGDSKVQTSPTRGQSKSSSTSNTSSSEDGPRVTGTTSPRSTQASYYQVESGTSSSVTGPIVGDTTGDVEGIDDETDPDDRVSDRTSREVSGRDIRDTDNGSNGSDSTTTQDRSESNGTTTEQQDPRRQRRSRDTTSTSSPTLGQTRPSGRQNDSGRRSDRSSDGDRQSRSGPQQDGDIGPLPDQRRELASEYDHIGPEDVALRDNWRGVPEPYIPENVFRRELREDVAAEYEEFGPQDITLVEEDGQLIPEIEESAIEREQAEYQEALREEVASGIEGVGPRGVKTVGFEEPGSGTSPVAGRGAAPQDVEPRLTYELTERAQATVFNQREDAIQEEIADEHRHLEPENVTVERGEGGIETGLTDEGRREVAAGQLGVNPEDDVRVVQGTTGSSPVRGQAAPEGAGERVVLTRSGTIEHEAETNPNIGGFDTIEAERDPAGGYEISFTEEEIQRRQGGSGGFADMGITNPDGPIRSALSGAGGALEPHLESAAEDLTPESVEVGLLAAEAAGVEEAGQSYSTIQSVEEGVAAGTNVPRGASDAVAAGQAVGYLAGQGEGDLVDRGRTFGRAFSIESARAARAAIRNPARTTGAIAGGAALGVGAVAGYRAVGSAATASGTSASGSAASTASGVSRFAQARRAGVVARDRIPAGVRVDPDAPLVELNTDVIGAARRGVQRVSSAPGAAYGRVTRVARDADPRQGIANAMSRMEAERLRGLRQMDLDAAVRRDRAAQFVGAQRERIADVPGRARSAMAETGRRLEAERQRGLRQMEFDAALRRDRATQLVGATRERIADVPGRASSAMVEIGRRLEAERQRGLRQMDLDAAVRRDRAAQFVDIQRERIGSGGRTDLGRPLLTDAETPGMPSLESAGRTDLGRPLLTDAETPSPSAFYRQERAALRFRGAEVAEEGFFGGQGQGTSLLGGGTGLRDVTIRIGRSGDAPDAPSVPSEFLPDDQARSIAWADADGPDLETTFVDDATDVEGRAAGDGTDTGRAVQSDQFTEVDAGGGQRQLARTRTTSRSDPDAQRVGIGREFDLRGPAAGAFAQIGRPAQTIDLDVAMQPTVDAVQPAEMAEYGEQEVTAQQDQIRPVQFEPVAGMQTQFGTMPVDATSVSTAQFSTPQQRARQRTTPSNRRPRRIPFPDPDFGADQAADRRRDFEEFQQSWVNPIAQLGTGAALFGGGDDGWL